MQFIIQARLAKLVLLLAVLTAASSCPDDCSGHGQCTSEDLCLCDLFYKGDNCSTKQQITIVQKELTQGHVVAMVLCWLFVIFFVIALMVYCYNREDGAPCCDFKIFSDSQSVHPERHIVPQNDLQINEQSQNIQNQSPQSVYSQQPPQEVVEAPNQAPQEAEEEKSVDIPEMEKKSIDLNEYVAVQEMNCNQLEQIEERKEEIENAQSEQFEQEIIQF